MYRQGAIYVVQEASPRDDILRELKKLDKNLFLQEQYGLDGQLVWAVVYDAEPPIPILEWRDEDNRPIPYLTHSVVDRVRAMERSDGKITQEAIRKNNEMIAEKQRAHDAEVAEIFREMIPMVEGRKRILAPRGQKLYQQRNRRRARGEI